MNGATSPSTDPVRRLQALLSDAWFEPYMNRYHPGESGIYRPKVLDPAVARSFLRGLDAGVFQIENGCILWPGGGTSFVYWEWKRTEVPRGIYPFREDIVTVAAVSDLHIDRHWPADWIHLQSPARGKVGRGALDFLVFEGPSRSNPVVMAGETKLTRRDVDRLVDEIRLCASSGPHDFKDCPHWKSRLRSHKKTLGLTAYRPACFWAVAASCARAFLLTYPDESPILHEIVDIPSFRSVGHRLEANDSGQ